VNTLFSSPALPPSRAKQTLAPFRLRRHADYQRVYQASRKFHSASLSYFFRVRPADEHPPVSGPRVGLTVGRVMGKAVERNRIKRRMREAARLQLSILHEAIPGEIDLVLHPRKSVATMEFAALVREMGKVFAMVAAGAANPPPPPPPRSSSRTPGKKPKAAAPSASGPSKPSSPGGSSPARSGPRA